MAKHKLQNYPTAELAHLKINALLVQLGREPLPESQMIAFFDQYLARIDELEEELAAKGTSAHTSSAQAGEADPIKPGAELHGIQRSAAAQRAGRTAKPTNPPSPLPSIGYGRAARAQQALNDRKNKS